MKKRLAGISNAGAASAERPFFDVSVELTVPRVTMNPTLDDIQAAINATAKKVGKQMCIVPRCTTVAMLALLLHQSSSILEVP